MIPNNQFWFGKDLPQPFSFGQIKQYFDGTIIGNTMIDKSGNGYHIDIINNDITPGFVGIPYKSGALIAQKVANFGLVPDPTNFWFTAGIPNQIPVVSLFQNIDYGNQIFTRHVAQSLNGAGEEIIEPAVIEFATYATVLTGASLTNANIYFGVPTEVTSNVFWVDGVNGNDTTGTGTKLLPWKTLSKANTGTSNKTIYVKTAYYTEASNLTLLTGQTWNFIGYCPLVSAGAAALVCNGTSGCTVNGAIVTPASGGRGFYFVSGNNNTVNRCKINNNGAFRNIQVLAGTGNVIRNSILINTGGTIHLHLSVGCDITGNYFGGLSSDNSIQFQHASTQTYNIAYNKFAQTVANTKYLFLYNFAGNYYVKYNTFKTTGGVGLLSLLNGASMTGINHWKYNDITYTNPTGSIIQYADQTNAVTIEIENNYFNIIGGLSSFYTVQILGQATPKVNNNYIYANTLFNGINIASQSVKGAAEINYNTICLPLDGGHITLGSDVNNTWDNGHNDSTIIGNKLYGVWYYSPVTVSNLGHGIAIFNCINCKVKYNYVNGANHLVVIKASDRTPAMVNTDCVVSYNIGINNEGSLFPKTMSGIKFYNNTTYADNPNIVNIAGGVYMLASTGPTINCEFRNNIFIDKTPLNANISVISVPQPGSLIGFVSNNNIIYSQNNFIADLSTVKKTWTQWQALGYDANSLNQDISFVNTITEKFYLNTPIFNGTNLTATYDDGLDTTTNWPIIITNQQGPIWQNGAYVQ